ncbi:MAG: metallophosphoesterase family protein [Verrucomicrobiales bacterium]
MPLPRTAFILAALALSCSPISAKTEKYRVIWNDSPHAKITVGWCQVDGTDPEVHYRPLGGGGDWVAHGVDRTSSHLGLESGFARLEGLAPDATYEFFVKDSNSESGRFRFRTAPSGPASFSFIAGGDSRNHRDARRRANRTVALLRPLFVCFGGDMISKPVTDDWAGWLDDWQLTTGEDGHMVPIIAARGNHESADCIHSFFDTPRPDDYYAVDFGGGFLRVYTLNSNIVRAGAQGQWLADDLAENSRRDLEDRPIPPSVPPAPIWEGGAERPIQRTGHRCSSSTEPTSRSNAIAMSSSAPTPSTINAPGSEQGFLRDDQFGITFIGEGCWKRRSGATMTTKPGPAPPEASTKSTGSAYPRKS